MPTDLHPLLKVNLGLTLFICAELLYHYEDVDSWFT